LAQGLKVSRDVLGGTRLLEAIQRALEVFTRHMSAGDKFVNRFDSVLSCCGFDGFGLHAQGG
jgi:hypothetical protein